MQEKILRLNLAGQPIEWLQWQDAVCLYARDLVAWQLGGTVKHVKGGRSRIDGNQTVISLPAIVACDGKKIAPMRNNPPLSNSGLFRRDKNQCLYCGNKFSTERLSRDHVIPKSRGGQDRWENLVTACKRCNQRKGDSLLEEIDMELLALPYKPNAYEYMALINSERIRGDQMDYLKKQFKQYQAPSRLAI